MTEMSSKRAKFAEMSSALLNRYLNHTVLNIKAFKRESILRTKTSNTQSFSA